LRCPASRYANASALALSPSNKTAGFSPGVCSPAQVATAAHRRQQRHLISILQHILSPRILLVHRHSNRIPNRTLSSPAMQRQQLRHRSSLRHIHHRAATSHNIVQNTEIENRNPHPDSIRDAASLTPSTRKQIGHRFPHSQSLSKQPRLPRIPNPPALHPRKLRHRMRPPRTSSIRLDKDVLHDPTPRQHRIPNQRPMAPPGHRLRAHHYGRIKVRQSHQPPDLLRKMIRLHIVRIPSKALVLPPRIHAVCPRLPSPAQPLPPNPTNIRIVQRGKQSLLAEMRMPPRPRKPPYIHQRRAPVLPQRPQERPKLQRRVPYRHHPHRLARQSRVLKSKGIDNSLVIPAEAQRSGGICC
jgi:hypothetical protein